MNSNCNHSAWIRLPSGKAIDLFDLSTMDWSNTDIALLLAKVKRWGGQSVWDLPMSVAQHSLLVLVLRRAASDRPLSREEALRELLHDVEEGFLGFDAMSPLKPLLGDRFIALSDQLRNTVFERYGLAPWSGVDYTAHKRADLLAATSEAIHVAGWSRQDVVERLGITLEPLAADPLASRFKATPWEPWPERVAAARFMSTFNGLVSSLRAAA